MRRRFRCLCCLSILTACLLASGCAMFHGWGQVGNPGGARLGASVDLPLGKK